MRAPSVVFVSKSAEVFSGGFSVTKEEFRLFTVVCLYLIGSTIGFMVEVCTRLCGKLLTAHLSEGVLRTDNQDAKNTSTNVQISKAG